MTKDDIIRMARQAGYQEDGFGFGIWDSKEFNAFASLVAAAEREACAQIVEMPWQGHYREVSAQIRARGQE